MADYGVFLSTQSGEVWVSPSSIPIALKSKKTANLQGSAGFNVKVTETFDPQYPIMAFVHTTVDTQVTQKVNGNTLEVEFLRPSGAGVGTVYFFSIFPQTAPKYGLAIWDESGKLILTNETKTLTDVVVIGTAGGNNNSGYFLNVVRPGKWACIPGQLGLITGVIISGQPRPYMAIYQAVAKREGGNTRIFARPQTAPDGNISNVVYSNMRNTIIAIDVSAYD